MFKSLLPALALLAAPLAAQTPGAPITQADMRRHIERLASDEFQGRAPATEGERLTTAYIVAQLQARGLEPAGENGSWFQRVPLVERGVGSVQGGFTLNGAPVPFDTANIILTGRDPTARLADAPVIFVGHGARIPDHGVDQLAGARLDGAVALILAEGPSGVPDFPSITERVQTVMNAGAGAVIVILGSDIPWTMVRPALSRRQAEPESEAVPPVFGLMPLSAAQALVAAGGGDMARLLNDQPGSTFRAVTLPIRASMEVTTSVTHYTTNNVIGRLRGSGHSDESVLMLAHWDHFGLCRPEGEPDRICNGAVDNASGVAMMIEVAGHLAQGPRPPRDILVLATTSEEAGLLGAGYFAAHPVVPLDKIQVAINMDTVAIHPAGEPVAVMGRGIAPLDAVIDSTIAAMGRRLDSDDEAAAFVRRQDGFRLSEAGVPAIMIGGSFSNMALLNGFLNGRYHKPDDQVDAELRLDGAAEDANLTVALVRRLADPAQYRRPEGSAP